MSIPLMNKVCQTVYGSNINNGKPLGDQHIKCVRMHGNGRTTGKWKGIPVEKIAATVWQVF